MPVCNMAAQEICVSSTQHGPGKVAPPARCAYLRKSEVRAIEYARLIESGARAHGRWSLLFDTRVLLIDLSATQPKRKPSVRARTLKCLAKGLGSGLCFASAGLCFPSAPTLLSFPRGLCFPSVDFAILPLAQTPTTSWREGRDLKARGYFAPR